MTATRRSLLQIAGALAAAPALPRAAQDWPSRPIRILVGTAAGGSPDIVSRLLADKLTERLGWTFVIENNTTGAGAVAQQLVSRSAPDGYTHADDDGRLSAADGAAQSRLRSARRLSPTSPPCAAIRWSMRSRRTRRSSRSRICSTRAKAEPGKLTYTITAQGSIYHVLTKWIELEVRRRR